MGGVSGEPFQKPSVGVQHLINQPFGKKFLRRIPHEGESAVFGFVHLEVKPDLRRLGQHVVEPAERFPAFLRQQGVPQIAREDHGRDEPLVGAHSGNVAATFS